MPAGGCRWRPGGASARPPAATPRTGRRHGNMRRRRRIFVGPDGATELVAAVRRLARPLHDAADLDPLLEQVGDARFTDMADEGMVNVGQLVRERHEGEGVVLVGFGSHRGSVIAGTEWDAPWERMPVLEAMAGSWEDVLHRAGADDKLLLFQDAEVPVRFRGPRGHRAIGVVYHPEYERYGNYVPTVLPRRYDAFVYLDETRALHPLPL